MMHDPVETQLILTLPSVDCASVETVGQVLAAGGFASATVDLTAFSAGQSADLEALTTAIQAADIPLLGAGEAEAVLEIVGRFGLDGVHLSGGPKQVSWARRTLGKTAILGFFAGLSRHDAMTAAEAGADYVAVGPAAELDPEWLSWWQAVIEAPLVVDGVNRLKPADPLIGVADFITTPHALWESDPVKKATEFRAALA